MAHHLAPRRLLGGVKSQLFKHGQKHTMVRARFFQVFLPFLLQVFVDGTGHGGLVHGQAADLSLQRLVKQFVDLFGVCRFAFHRGLLVHGVGSPVAPLVRKPGGMTRSFSKRHAQPRAPAQPPG
ncbi:hypothetical protein D3C71_1767770 [compost metagenome]